MSKNGHPLADRPAEVTLDETTLLAAGFRPYERFRLILTHSDGSQTVQQRDIVRGGRVVGVLAYDPGRDAVVLIRQFRLPAHLATGRGEMVEVVAGIVEPGEDPEATALRECAEEIGVVPHRLIPMVRFLPTPGVTDELVILYLGLVDAADVPERAGAPEEGEATFPFVVPVAEALNAMEAGAFSNGFAIIALQWLALNRAGLAGLE